jgi:hypothetical protein
MRRALGALVAALLAAAPCHAAVPSDVAASGRPALRLNGVIGLDVFGKPVVHFDLPGTSMALLPSGTDVAKVAGVGARPVAAGRPESGLLAVPIMLGTTEAIAVIDTGARRSRINSRLATALGLSAETPGPAIILGLDWLDKLRMVIDFPRAQVWFAPSEGKRT